MKWQHYKSPRGPFGRRPSNKYQCHAGTGTSATTFHHATHSNRVTETLAEEAQQEAASEPQGEVYQVARDTSRRPGRRFTSEQAASAHRSAYSRKSKARWQRSRERKRERKFREHDLGERTRTESRAKQREEIINSSITKTFGFVPDLDKTPFQNAMDLLDNTIENSNTLPIPSNMAFHDLTSDKSAPKNCKELFGLGSKFIPTPKKTTGKTLLCQTHSRFDRDFRLKVHFAGDCSPSDEEADHKSKLYVKSK
eukprot:scaffold247_cov39-Cyclotella_meneghiniana.AAC.3